jgi:hypothetical protein
MAEQVKPTEQAKPIEQAKSNDKVIVGCKLPHGLYLDLYDKNGNLKARVKLPGVAGYTLPNPDRKFVNPELTHGDTLTGVDRGHWEAWHEQHRDHPALLSGAIYAKAKREDAVAVAKEHQVENVGFDKIDPTKHGVKKLDPKNDKPE